MRQKKALEKGKLYKKIRQIKSACQKFDHIKIFAAFFEDGYIKSNTEFSVGQKTVKAIELIEDVFIAIQESAKEKLKELNQLCAEIVRMFVSSITPKQKLCN